MFHLSEKLQRSERGQGLVEYALVLVFIAVAVIASAALFGQELEQVYCEIVQELNVNDSSGDGDCSATSGGGGENNNPTDLTVSCVGSPSGSSPFRLEAAVTDNVGDDNVARVEFQLDGNPFNREYNYKYCFKGGNDPCQLYDPSSLSSGTHTIKAVAEDSDGNTGSCTVSFTVPTP
jgi:Flp pilus assembly pilin Flp